MEINKQLFEDVLLGKLKGTFVLRNGNTYFSNDLYRNYNKFRFTHPYIIGFLSYTPKGIFFIDDTTSRFDIINFIPNTDMKENELTIEVPQGKIVDWDESKKQNKIVLKDKQLTYEDVCKKLFNGETYYTNTSGKICSSNITQYVTDPNNATTKHQLECILAKNKLANVAKYLNDEWESNSKKNNYGFFIFYNYNHKKFYFAESTDWVRYNNVLFKTQELAQQAIEILGEETVKLALEPLGI